MSSPKFFSENKDNRRSLSREIPNAHKQYEISEKTDSKKPIPVTEHMVYKYSNDGLSQLHESILINNKGYFLSIKDSRTFLHEKIEISDQISLIPPKDRTSYLSKEYSFSSLQEIEEYVKRAKKETLSTLFIRVKRIWRKCFDIHEDALNLCTADTLFTYFQDKLGMTHYLLFVGDNGTGKSNALRILYNLGYRPILDTDITPANIYNFLGQSEEGQGIILEDEIDDIEKQDEKMRIYKGGYVLGTKVTRLYESSNNLGSKKKQLSFFTFSFKAFSSEKNPSFLKAKGFNERLLVINCSSGTPLYDITELGGCAGDPKLAKLKREIEDSRKLLFVYRLLNHWMPIPDIELSISNRDKQLCKPLLRLFQNTIVIDKIKKSLSKFIVEKKNKKLNTFDAFLYSIVSDSLAQSYGDDESNNLLKFISNETLWNLVLTLPGNLIPNKPLSYLTEEFGIISKWQVRKICEDKFVAKQKHDGKDRGLIFEKKILDKLKVNYVVGDEIEITSHKNNNINYEVQGTNTFNTFNTFWNSIEHKNSNETTRKERSRRNLMATETKGTERSTSENIDSDRMDAFEKSSIDSEKVLEPLEALESYQPNYEKISKPEYVLYLDSRKERSDGQTSNILENNPSIGYKKPFYYCREHPNIVNIHYEEIVDHINHSNLHNTLNR